MLDSGLATTGNSTSIATATTGSFSKPTLAQILHTWGPGKFAPQALCEDVGVLALQPGLDPDQAVKIFKRTFGKHQTLATVYKQVKEVTSHLINPENEEETKKNLEQYYQRLAFFLESINEPRKLIETEFKKEDFDLNQAHAYQYKLCSLISSLAADSNKSKAESLAQINNFCTVYYNQNFKPKNGADIESPPINRRLELVKQIEGKLQ